MKKILHIQVLPQMSGVQRISLDLLKSLPQDEFEKHILFGTEIEGEKRQECQRLFEAAGVKVIYLDCLKRSIGLSDLPAAVAIYKLCKKERYDIVHTHSTKPGIIGRIAATLARVPFVIHTVHGLAFHDYVKFPMWQFYWACEMFASLFCDRIILVNQYYKKYFKWFKRKTSTIYNGVDFSQYSVANSPSDRTSNESIKILSVGRLDKPKDPLTLLKAAQIVIRKIPSTRFTIVGNGELYESCKQYVFANGMQDSVDLVGWRNDVNTFYGSHDIFVLTSIYESFGLIFVEAGYHYLPTVATRVEGIPEVVRDGETGLLASARDVEGIAQHLIRLIDDACLRQEMGLKAHRWVLDHFSMQRMVNQYLEVYRDGKI